MDEELKSWGVNYSQAVNYIQSYVCSDCDFDYLNFQRGGYYKHIVGFSPDPPFQPVNSNSVGLVIVECPNCFTKCWFHIDKIGLSLCKDKCLNWPKTPEK